MAGDEMVEQALKQAEIQRLNIRITDAAVDAAFAQFAGGNKLSPKQMAGILDKAGVTAVALQGIHPHPDGLEPGRLRALPRRRAAA